MWNPNFVAINSQEEDDSWEVKAFEEDAGSVMGTTWPPRSYTCTFCRREFRSAQALGGHMNVHRRDRARLHQARPNFKNPNLSSSSSLLINPTQELVANGGLCLLYTVPSPNAIINPSSLSNVQVRAHRHSFMNSSLSNSTNTEASMSTTYKSNQKDSPENKRKKIDSTIEGIDLELRLGCSSSAS